ncbi:hypothetical protein ACIA48_14500 [Mycobacterium sp. NPDC051804]|uniref:hypothetical protein n=1 Tax=Mycobacterium sp. NPDC051804 TaxID=3364295 RepID=UPI00378E4F89
MDQVDPEKRIAELERQLNDAKLAAGQDQAGEPPPQFSDTQPISLPGFNADGRAGQYAPPRPPTREHLTPDMHRARRNARFRAQGRAMYAQSRRTHAGHKRRFLIIVLLNGVFGLLFLAVMVLTIGFPSSTRWMSGIVCSSPFHLEYDTSRYSYRPGQSTSTVNYECVSSEGSYDLNDSVVWALQSLFVALVLGAVGAFGFVLWRWLRNRTRLRHGASRMS